MLDCAWKDKMMEINPADKQILGLTELVYQKSARQAENNPKSQAAAFDKSFDGYIAKALSASSEEPVDIEQIRKEMNAGQLDSPQAIRQAAQNILTHGI
jgi:type IV secretory pathway VirD2 relaxase